MKRLVSVAVLVFVVVGTAGAAGAHVTVEPETAAPETVVRLSFVVPNERPTEATVKVQVQLSKDDPLPYVSVRPTPGWTATVEKAAATETAEVEGHSTGSETVSSITWEGGRIEPDQYQVFEVEMGPMPTGVDELFFPAIQTYANGEEVAWIERPTASVPDPPLPAPVLKLSATTSADGASSDTAATSDTSSDDDSDSSNVLAGLALGVGIVALVIGVIGLGRTLGRRRTE